MYVSLYDLRFILKRIRLLILPCHVLLMEIFTGRSSNIIESLLLMVLKYPRVQTNCLDGGQVAEAWRLELLDNLLDPNIRGEYDKDEFFRIAFGIIEGITALSSSEYALA